MAASEAQITAGVRRIGPIKAAEKALGFCSVCLIGPGHPVPREIGSNATWTPVSIRTGSDPRRAADRTNSEHWSRHQRCKVLDFFWASNDLIAERLKGLMYVMFVGNDPDMTQLEGKWVDCPDWEIQWPLIAGDAIRELRGKGNKFEVFGNDAKERRVALMAERMFPR